MRLTKPLKGHRYHDFSNDSLRYIIKDASEARELATEDRNVWKYSDQISDAVTILNWRSKK